MTPQSRPTLVAWLRRSFITGFFVMVPLVVSVAALVWIFQVVDGVTVGQMETLLVLMAARMPQITADFEVSGIGALTGLRLLLGKLEAGRSEGGETLWGPLPHHSTLIGSK